MADETKKDETKPAPKAAEPKVVCLAREVVIGGQTEPRGKEFPADSDLVKRALEPAGVVITKRQFDAEEALKAAQAEATKEAGKPA